MSRDRDFSGEPDDRLEALLRDALREEAETVVPAGDGLSRIQNEVRRHRLRRRWTVPALAGGSAAVLVLAGVGAYALVGHGGGDDRVVVDPATTTPAATASDSPSPSQEPVALPDFPAHAIFPFTSAAEERTWEKGYENGSSPWAADDKTVALMWVDNILGLDSVDQVLDSTGTSDGTTTVTLGRVLKGESTQPVAVTAVHLAKYGKAWIVVGADDPAGLLSLTDPQAGDTVSSPVTVTGPGFGVDEAAQVEVRDAESPTRYGVGHASFGNGTKQWQVDVDVSTPAGPVGTVMAVVESAADGGPQRMAAVQVHFATVSNPSSAPKYFYAAKDGRVAKYARNGSFVSYLTEPQPGGGADDPQFSDTTGTVYYLQGNGTCSNALMAVGTGDGKTRSVAVPDDGYVITGYGVLEPSGAPTGSHATGVAYYETACGGQTSPQARLVIRAPDGATNSVKFPAQPPMVVGDPTWEPDGTRVDAFVRTGNSGYLASYRLSGDSPTPSEHACPGFDVNNGEPQAIENDGSGQLWVATQTGSSIDVVRCAPDGPVKAFTIPGQDSPADVDVTSDGQAVLLTDADGKVWRWDGSGNPTALDTGAALTHVTW